jgi:hypothetical protein
MRVLGPRLGLLEGPPVFLGLELPLDHYREPVSQWLLAQRFFQAPAIRRSTLPYKAPVRSP